MKEGISTQRRRNSRTLEALSLALGWHPEHLDALLCGHTPPDGGQPDTSPIDPVVARLTSIDRRLAAIERRLDELMTRDGYSSSAGSRPSGVLVISCMALGNAHQVPIRNCQRLTAGPLITIKRTAQGRFIRDRSRPC